MNLPNLETVRTVMRETAVDAMPELAPRLASDPTAVQQHVLGALGIKLSARELLLINDWPDPSQLTHDNSPLKKIDPTTEEIETAQTAIKYERYTLLQSGLRRQADLLLGERPDNPAEAQFLPDRLIQCTSRSINGYTQNHMNMFYTAGGDTFAQNPWLNNVDNRYRYLYQPFNTMRFDITHPELPSLVMEEAMNGAGLRQHMADTVEFLRSHRDTRNLLPKTRVKVAHDLAYLGLAFASQHFENVAYTSIINLKGDIQQLPNGRWIYIRGDKKRDPEYHRVTNRTKLYAPTLKCPVHQPDSQTPTSDLEYYLHASITAANSYDLFES